MPVTIKKSVFKYKNQNGQYVNVDMAAERPLAEQIAEIEAAGEDVLESIPSDYTELEGRVDDLETDLAVEVQRASGVEADLTTGLAGKINKPSNGNGTAGQILRTDGAGGTSWENAATSAEISAATETWLEDNITNPSNPPLDRSLSLENAAAPADIVGDLKSAINAMPGNVNTDVEDVDLDIVDPSGNVILRMADGHVQTKEFDSSELQGKFDAKQDELTFDSTPTENSVNPVTSGGIYEALQDVELDISVTPKISETEAEDVDLDVTDPSGNVLLRLANGHVKTKNFDSANVETLVDSEYTESDSDFYVTDAGGNVLLTIHDGNLRTKRFNSLIVNPNIITVKKDGTGDYQNIRSAVESITNASVDNPYIIEIYEGTYNILEDYTSEEIAVNGFQGLKITEGMYLKGIGNRDKVILYGILDTEQYTMEKRNDIATLNPVSECGMENLTVIGEQIRYAVHDDFSESFRSLYGRNPKRTLRNCTFVGINTTGNHAYGAGTSKARDFIIENCAFPREPIGIHMQVNMSDSGQIIMTNCSGTMFALGDYSTSESSPIHTLIAQHIRMYGSGNYNAFISVPAGFVYKTGNVETTSIVLATGDVITADYGVATKDTAYGVCIGTFEELSYVQRGGYILASLLGLSVSAGQYIGIVNGKAAVVNDASDSIGHVIAYSNSQFIKLTI